MKAGTLLPDHPAVERIAVGSISVLILGETGAGKEVVAERIHRLSPRAAQPLIRLNCAAFSESLLESEWFGYERGAFTGAVTTKVGLIEAAAGGTLFLDEVGELSLPMQAKLLRVLAAREVLPVGGTRARNVDVRFIAATNRDLEAEIEQGRFRSDLYYRLSGVTIFVPPLRDSIARIEGLARSFIEQVCGELGRSPCPKLTAQSLEVLRAYPWPGNVRELRNVVERAVLFCSGDEIVPADLPLLAPAARLANTTGQRGWTANERSAPEADSSDSSVRKPESPQRVMRELELLEKQRILQALEMCAGNQSRAAKLLGIPRRTFLKRLDSYGIPRPRKGVIH